MNEQEIKDIIDRRVAELFHCDQIDGTSCGATIEGRIRQRIIKITQDQLENFKRELAFRLTSR